MARSDAMHLFGALLLRAIFLFLIMDFDNSQVNPDSTSTAVGSDSTGASSTAGVSSNPEPQTAQSLVDSYFSDQQQSSFAEATEEASAESVTPDDMQEFVQEADSAASSEEEVDPHSLSKEQAWEHVRGLREIKKTLEPQAKAYSHLVGQLEQAGLSPEVLTPGVELLTGLLAQTEQGPTTEPFLEFLENKSNPRLAQLLKDAANRYPDYLLNNALGREKALQALGLDPKLYDTYRAVNPDGSLQGQTVGGYDPEILASIPEHLRDTYKSLPLDDQLELDGLSADRRAQKLQREFDINGLQQREQQREQQAAQAREQAIAEAKDTRLQQFVTDQETSFYNELKQGFSPFGEDKPELTRFFHDAIYSHVTKSLSANPTSAKALQALANAVRENDTIAQSQLLAQVNVHVAKARNQIVSQLNETLFDVVQGKAQAARVNASKQINLNGQGGFSADRQPSQMPNLNDPAYYDALIERSGLRF